MAEPSKIVVTVSGGVVMDVYAQQKAEVTLLDYDDRKAQGFSDYEIQRELDRETQGLQRC